MKLGHMLPGLTVQYVANVCQRNGIFSSQCFPSKTVIELLANIRDLLCSQFGKMNSFAANSAAPVASFANHIRMIVLSCAEKKVARVTARWIVALMQNAKFAREFAKRQLVSDTMRSILPVLNFDNTVLMSVFGGLPFPTVIGAKPFDFRPETLNCGWGKTRGSGMLGHSNVSFVDLLTPPNDSTRCGGNSLPTPIIPQEAGL